VHYNQLTNEPVEPIPRTTTRGSGLTL